MKDSYTLGFLSWFDAHQDSHLLHYPRGQLLSKTFGRFKHIVSDCLSSFPLSNVFEEWQEIKETQLFLCQNHLIMILQVVFIL